MRKTLLTAILALFGVQGVLILLKGLNVINWAWYLILLPILGPYCLLLSVGILGILYIYLSNLVERIFKKRHG